MAAKRERWSSEVPQTKRRKTQKKEACGLFLMPRLYLIF